MLDLEEIKKEIARACIEDYTYDVPTANVPISDIVVDCVDDEVVIIYSCYEGRKSLTMTSIDFMVYSARHIAQRVQE